MRFDSFGLKDRGGGVQLQLSDQFAEKQFPRIEKGPINRVLTNFTDLQPETKGMYARFYKSESSP